MNYVKHDQCIASFDLSGYGYCNQHCDDHFNKKKRKGEGEEKKTRLFRTYFWMLQEKFFLIQVVHHPVSCLHKG